VGVWTKTIFTESLLNIVLDGGNNFLLWFCFILKPDQFCFLGGALLKKMHLLVLSYLGWSKVQKFILNVYKYKTKNIY
jgi:hypothetical protein